ncbi:MAG: sigma-E factor negative regulatory protein [Telluria sp.]|nr:sigma-E factor negative regulatory protein [Telluria sp.]
METHKKIREHISALSDGELSKDDQELAFAALQSADGQQAWNVYHRIGDVLRAQATPELSDNFGARLAARLAAEPAPGKRVARTAVTQGAPGKRAPAGGNGAAANADGAATESTDAKSVNKPKPAIASVS